MDAGTTAEDIEHATAAELEAALDWLRLAPRDGGVLELIVRRPDVGERELVACAEVSQRDGLVGDNWRVRRSASKPDALPDPDRQLTLIGARVAALVAKDADRRQLAGDQLFVDFDLSVDNAPPGTRIRIGHAVIEFTQPPHLGCAKFLSRFGQNAMRFVNSEAGRRLRLRGANAKVVTAGRLCVGDSVIKVR